MIKLPACKALQVLKLRSIGASPLSIAGRPNLKIKFKILIVLLFVLLLSFNISGISFAADPTPTTVVPTTPIVINSLTPTVDPSTPGGATVPTPATTDVSPTPAAAGWRADAEVTFVGKTASRSAQFIDWTLQNYNWLCVNKISENQCDNTGNPLVGFWVTIRNIVYALIAIFVLVTAFILIVTRGRNVTIMKFIPRFIVIVLLITFSFSLVQFIYQISDVVQGFFLRNLDGTYISTKNLLYMGFNYDFQGYRYVDSLGTYDESAFISLLLVRLTAITYYVMTGILLIRKIILWFFIIISPIFPLLIFYKPLRNTAKIWIGEFFRWLLYAPLFAVLLQGLVRVWEAGIPLAFNFTHAADNANNLVVYPTGVSILLGGPGQYIFWTSATHSNSVNLPDTFAQYVVALLMLWIVILLPFLLLKIFLDYLGGLSFDTSLITQKIRSRNLPFLGPSGGPTPGPTPPGQTQPTGSARSMPFYATRAAAVPVQYQTSVQSSVHESTDILKSANLSVPRMRDIAAYETSLMSTKTPARAQASSVNSSLAKIANPALATSAAEREKFSTVREKLLAQKQKGNPIAASVLSASSAQTQNKGVESQVSVKQQQREHLDHMLKSMVNPELATAAEKERLAKIKQELEDKKAKGDKLAESILTTQDEVSKSTNVDQKEAAENKLIEELLDAEKAGDTLAKEMLPQAAPAQAPSLPMVNHVQQVSLEDYEEVRKLWTENYETLEPPRALNGEQVDRREWIKNDIDKINQAITLLSGVDPQRVNQGMSMVSSILPFLLVGGFSKSEVIAYLKAKMEAGKQVLENVNKKETEEESQVARKTTTTSEAGHQEASIARPLDDEEKPAANTPKAIDEAKFFPDEEKPGENGQNGANSGGQI